MTSLLNSFFSGPFDEWKLVLENTVTIRNIQSLETLWMKIPISINAIIMLWPWLWVTYKRSCYNHRDHLASDDSDDEMIMMMWRWPGWDWDEGTGSGHQWSAAQYLGTWHKTSSIFSPEIQKYSRYILLYIYIIRIGTHKILLRRMIYFSFTIPTF